MSNNRLRFAHFFPLLVVLAVGQPAAFGQRSLSATSSVETDSAKPSSIVRFLSYNIRYANPGDGKDFWPNRKAAVASTLDQVDIFGLQEALPSQLNDLQELTTEFAWYGIGRNDGMLSGETTAIGWRKDRFLLLGADTIWLSPTPLSIGSKGWDAALPRIASWVTLLDQNSGKRFTFLNTHFDHRGQTARAESALLIRKWCTENSRRGPFVISGDLNAQLNSEPLNNLLGKNDSGLVTLLNTREVASQPDTGPDSTWNGFRKIEPGRRIDFLLASEGLTVNAFQTLDPKTDAGRFASDHLPVQASVQF